MLAAFTRSGTVTGDGLRLRILPDQTVLELMYIGEKVLADPETIYNPWVYLKRVKTGTIGYSDVHYLSF